MIGLVLVFVSWVLLRVEGRRLTELGFNAPVLRASQFLVGFLVAGSVVAVQQVGLSTVTGVGWQLTRRPIRLLFYAGCDST